MGVINVCWPSQPNIQHKSTCSDRRPGGVAIENVRLFNKTRKLAGAADRDPDVLQISKSVADAQPVFDKIVQSCQRLFNGSLVGQSGAA